MGTGYNVKYLPPQQTQQSPSAELIGTQIHSHLRRIDALMSTYQKDSEVSRFNRAPVQDWFAVSSATMEVITLAQQISEQTQGAFDISVASLVTLWGFGPGYQQQQIPAAKAIEEMLKQVGFANLEIDKTTQKIRKLMPLSIDLSAIAKGYGVDQVAAYLETAGVVSYMVEVGGEIRAKGLKPGDLSWRIAIEAPDSQQRSAQRIIDVTDQAVATSGDYRNYFEQAGQRYSHTIDPQTGYPVTHNLASVTVLSDSAAHADALATAFSVMGAEKAQAFAKAYNVAAYFIIKKQDGFVELASDAFNSMTSGGLE